MIVRGIGVHLQLTQPGTACDTNRVAGRSDRMHNKRVQRTPAAPLTRNVLRLKKLMGIGLVRKVANFSDMRTSLFHAESSSAA